VGNWCAAPGFLELVVMVETKKGLEDEEGDDHRAEYRVSFPGGFVELGRGVSISLARIEGRN